MPEKKLTKQSLLSELDKEKENYEKKKLRLNPSFAPTLPNLIELIDLYSVSKFRDGDFDNLGFRKVFYNIVILPVEVASKMLNLDTKDINLIGENWDDYFTSWIKGKSLKNWLENKYFGRQLNLYPFLFSKYGFLVVKKLADDAAVVDLNNLIFRPDAEDIKESPIIEKHISSQDAFETEAKNRGWSNYKQVSAKAAKDKEDVLFYEIYYPPGFLNSKYNYFIVSPSAKEVLTYMEMEDCPYKKLDWEKVSGRQPRGQVERLFEDQIYLNRLANYKAEGLHWSSKHIFQTRDQNVISNLMTNTENGDILTVNSEVNPVSTEERNLGFYGYEESRWENMAFKKSFASEPITGGRAPSGTPLGSTIIQTQMSTGYYNQKRDDLASFVKEILWDWIIPSFEENNSKDEEVLIENLITVSDSMAEKFVKRAVSNKLAKRKMEMFKKGKIPSKQEEELMRAVIYENLKRKKIKVGKEDFKNLKHKIDIVITGESIDTASKLTTLQVLIQMLGSNPGIISDKRVFRIIKKALDLSGFNPNEFDFENEVEKSVPGAAEEARASMGGSLPAAPKASTATAVLPTRF